MTVRAPPAETASDHRSERMDAAARAAGALAHEFANYLGTMRAALDLLVQRPGPDPQVRQDLGILARTVDGASAFVDALRRFARPPSLGPGPADLNAVLRDAEPSLQAALRRGATLSLAAPSRPLSVRAGADGLRELALDLVASAGQALEAGGRIEIETRRVPDGEHGAPAAMLVVRAAGRGLEPEQAARIFEPYVLDRGWDAGLKLPTVYRIVVASGGAITARSTPESGTEIRVRLPLAAASAGGRRPAG